MNSKTERLVWAVIGAAALLWSGLGAPVRAGGSPDNLAVVVNAESWASKTIANHYIQLRGVPTANVVYLTGLKEFQTTNIETFREQILLPVMKTLYNRGVLTHIDCIAYSADLPTAIDAKTDFTGQKLPKQQRPVASINGLTYLYQLVLAKRPDYLRLNVNFYMRQPIRATSSKPLSADDIKALQKGLRSLGDKQWEAAHKILQPLAAKRKSDASLQYNFACCLARLDRDKEAIDALTLAVLAGWADRKHAEKDEDLLTLRGSVNFKALLSKMDENRKKPFEVQPTTAFSSQDQWNARGEKVKSQGIRYMLSTVLAVTSGRGNSVSEALDALRRSVAADATQPKGTIYFMENSDVRSTTRQPGFVSAVKALVGTPVTGRILPGVLPERKKDVAGTMVGKASFSWAKSGSTILPGAICEHLTSYGGAMLETNSQTPLTEFIRYGAAGTSGTVTEPYAIQAKFPFSFIHVHYARGCSLAEAFYQSVFGPYQLLIIGDPLCQPWAKPLQIKVNGLKPNQRVSGKILITPEVVGGPAAAAMLDHFEVYIDGHRGAIDPKVRNVEIETEQFGDGWHELSVVAVAKGATATKSRLVLPLIVNNGGGGIAFELVDNASGQITYGDEVVVRAKMALTAKIEVANHGYLLGTIDGPEGTLRIRSQDLGIGPVCLQATTRIEDKAVYSAPVLLQVNPPVALHSVAGVNASKLKPGIAMVVGGGSPVMIDATKSSKWLVEKKPKAGESLQLSAFFSVASDDLCQFQFRGNAVGEILVDGQSLWRAENASSGAPNWTMVPVHLAKGWHQFQLKGTVAKTPRLEIRFGSKGCKSLDGKRFKHKE